MHYEVEQIAASRSFNDLSASRRNARPQLVPERRKRRQRFVEQGVFTQIEEEKN